MMDYRIWTPTELYCPFCGEQTVECIDGLGDYYDGPEHRCTSCEKTGWRGP